MLGLLVEWYTEPAIRQGEVDRAVGLDHDIVRPIELASLEAACNHSNAAVEILPGDAPGGLAGDEPALNMRGFANSPWTRSDLDYKASNPMSRRLSMSYTLDQFSADCRAALLKNPGPAGREFVRHYTEKASSDPEFIAKYLGPDAEAERRILYEDPDLHFCILAHVYKGAKNSAPHDHGPSWAIYSQVAGVTEMTDWRLIERSANGRPGKVEKIRTYELTPGKAHLYNEGDLHSPRRESETRLIRIEGVDLTTVKRDKFEIAA
jgi:hypothetical protein